MNHQIETILIYRDLVSPEIWTSLMARVHPTDRNNRRISAIELIKGSELHSELKKLDARFYDEHELRVVAELRELTDKLRKLESFIYDSPIFRKMDGEDRRLMIHQKDIMAVYADILNKRITRF